MNKPKLWMLDLADTDRSLDDPALRALVDAGWTVGASFPAAAQDSDRPKLGLLLWPPARSAEIMRPIMRPIPAPWQAYVALAFGMTGFLMAVFDVHL